MIAVDVPSTNRGISYDCTNFANIPKSVKECGCKITTQNPKIEEIITSKLFLGPHLKLKNRYFRKLASTTVDYILPQNRWNKFELERK